MRDHPTSPGQAAVRDAPAVHEALFPHRLQRAGPVRGGAEAVQHHPPAQRDGVGGSAAVPLVPRQLPGAAEDPRGAAREAPVLEVHPGAVPALRRPGQGVQQVPTDGCGRGGGRPGEAGPQRQRGEPEEGRAPQGPAGQLPQGHEDAVRQALSLGLHLTPRRAACSPSPALALRTARRLLQHLAGPLQRRLPPASLRCPRDPAQPPAKREGATEKDGGEPRRKPLPHDRLDVFCFSWARGSRLSSPAQQGRGHPKRTFWVLLSPAVLWAHGAPGPAVGLPCAQARGHCREGAAVPPGSLGTLVPGGCWGPWAQGTSSSSAASSCPRRKAQRGTVAPSERPPCAGPWDRARSGSLRYDAQPPSEQQPALARLEPKHPAAPRAPHCPSAWVQAGGGPGRSPHGKVAPDHVGRCCLVLAAVGVIFFFFFLSPVSCFVFFLQLSLKKRIIF